MDKHALLRGLPKIDELLRQLEPEQFSLPAPAVTQLAREALEQLRADILAGEITQLPSRQALCDQLLARARAAELPSLRRVINGTGIVLHTNLGRACLSARAVEAVAAVAGGYSTLEYDLEKGGRGSRHSHIEQLLCTITGAEAAMVVNNNAAAVLLILSALARGGEVVVSRGELVEIGGSFRIPDIMVQSGCGLREVGTTNKTHLRDYESAIGQETRALLKVHTSNYKIMGFSESVSLEDLVALGHQRGLPVIEDLGSGSLIDLERFSIHGEPTVQQSIDAGIDVLSFSGDKLLGGPQAGIILGRKKYIDLLKTHPLARAVRVDKMTIAALRETLFSYVDPNRALREAPVLSMLAVEEDALHSKAALLCQMLAERGVSAQIVPTEDPVGGGAVPTQLLPGWAVALEAEGLTVDQMEERLRRRPLPIIGRIYRNQYLLDVRTLWERDFESICQAAAEVTA